MQPWQTSPGRVHYLEGLARMEMEPMSVKSKGTRAVALETLSPERYMTDDLSMKRSLAEELSTKPPSGGMPGLMELLWHWERIPVADRKRLLLVARMMGKPLPEGERRRSMLVRV